MAQPGRPIILTAFDAMEAALAAMSQGRGSHRNYRGVERTFYGWEDEKDPALPMVLLYPRSGPPRSAESGDEIATQYIRHGSYFGVTVHTLGDRFPDGTH